MSSAYTKRNIADIEDSAPGFGLQEMGSARFLRQALGAQTIGMAHYRLHPGRRVGFGHRHSSVEEVYVVLGGSGRMKLDDEIIDLAPHDVVFVPPAVMRAWEAGDEGMEMLAFGAHAEGDADMAPGWWAD